MRKKSGVMGARLPHSLVKLRLLSIVLYSQVIAKNAGSADETLRPRPETQYLVVPRSRAILNSSLVPPPLPKGSACKECGRNNPSLSVHMHYLSMHLWISSLPPPAMQMIGPLFFVSVSLEPSKGQFMWSAAGNNF